MSHYFRILKKLILLFVILFVSNILASFFLGFVTTMGSNIQLVGLTQVSFDPMITIAYMILYYFVTLFFQPAPRVQFYLFLFVLFLSYTVPFIQGSLFLVTFYFLLRKFRIM